jgi:AcrR family transcriptional regulator
LSSEKVADGRTTRGERNREALLDAAYDLIVEGNLAPSSQEIAQRAGVGLRGIFRHFGDMEGLRAALDERTTSQGAARFAGGNREGSFRERLLHAVERHATAYEANNNFFRAMQIDRWNSEVLRKSYDRDNHRLRKDFEDWLPELKSLSLNRREAVDAAASFETWQRLREYQHQDIEAAIDIVFDMIKVLMTAP